MNILSFHQFSPLFFFRFCTFSMCRPLWCSLWVEAGQRCWGTRKMLITCTSRPSTSLSTSWSSLGPSTTKRMLISGSKHYWWPMFNNLSFKDLLFFHFARSLCLTWGSTRWKGTTWRTTRGPSRTCLPSQRMINLLLSRDRLAPPLVLPAVKGPTAPRFLLIWNDYF